MVNKCIDLAKYEVKDVLWNVVMGERSDNQISGIRYVDDVHVCNKHVGY
jgi:hypothetical protein